MFIENVINIACQTFIKMPAHMKPKSFFTTHCPPGNSPHFHEFIFLLCWHFDKGLTCNIDDILNEHDGLPHVPLLAVHLVMLLMSVNSFSLCGILIKVRQAILMTFTIIMLSCPMSPLLLSTWEWSSGWSPKYQVWHINQNPNIDWQLMVMFSGPKSTNHKICPLLRSKNVD